MTRTEAIEILEECWRYAKTYKYTDAEIREALDMAIKALREEPCDIIKCKVVKALQSLEKSQREKGNWRDKKTTIKGAHGLAYGRWGCSVCKSKFPSKSNFCPNCGADMRGESE